MDKILIIGVIAVLIVGPERLPKYAAMLGDFVRRARDYMRTAQDRVKTEMGEDFDDVDWKKLDPRQYDPRRIVREALLDDATPPRAGTAVASHATVTATAVGTSTTAPAPSAPARRRIFTSEEPPPYDDEAT